MGLLDDAIREHLDLKRRRGADPADVERDEREALGPVRRAPEGAEDDSVPAPGTDIQEESAYHQAGEPGWDEEPASEGIIFEEELAARDREAAAPSVPPGAVRS